MKFRFISIKQCPRHVLSTDGRLAPAQTNQKQHKHANIRLTTTSPPPRIYKEEAVAIPHECAETHR
jgi:hypothetical protein